MEEAFNKENPTYTKHHKIFFFGDTGGSKNRSTGIITKLAGKAEGFDATSALLFGGKTDTTVIHELLHCLGLEHSFKNKEHCFVKGKTKNIMDYATNNPSEKLKKQVESRILVLETKMTELMFWNEAKNLAYTGEVDTKLPARVFFLIRIWHIIY